MVGVSPRRMAVAGMVCSAVLLSLDWDVQAQLSLHLDYRYDSSGFFDTPERRATLEAAANEYSSRMIDLLSAVAPSGTNAWNALVVRPDTGTMELLPNLVVQANTLTIFVGARSLGRDVLGNTAIGGLAARGSTEWMELVRYRGQSGSPFHDFGPWGGSIAFDGSPETQWYFDPDPFSLGDLPPRADDFFSVAVHELGHLLGVGTAAPWHLQIGDGFMGKHSVLAFGGPVPIDAGQAHWADGTMSMVFGTELPQEAALAPDLPLGSRKFLTDLDVAGLRDVGWNVVPEPSVASLTILSLIVGCFALQPVRNGQD